MRESMFKGLDIESARAALQAPLEDAGKPALVALFLPLDTIQPDPEQPRRSMEGSDPDSQSLEELSASILQHGVLQPITVETLEKGRYQIIAGERRWRAARMALESGQVCTRKDYDLARIPAVITRSEGSANRLEMQLVENLAREDMKAEDVAAAVQTLLRTLHVSKRELANRIGRSEGWIRQALATGSDDAQQIAERLHVSLNAVGIRDMQTLIGWKSSPDKAYLLNVLADKVQSGIPLTRRLLDELEIRHRIESLYPSLKGRDLPLEDLKFVDAHLKDENSDLQASAWRIVYGDPELVESRPDSRDKAAERDEDEITLTHDGTSVGMIGENAGDNGVDSSGKVEQVSARHYSQSDDEALEQDDVYIPRRRLDLPGSQSGGEAEGETAEEAPDMIITLSNSLVVKILRKAGHGWSARSVTEDNVIHAIEAIVQVRSGRPDTDI